MSYTLNGDNLPDLNAFLGDKTGDTTEEEMVYMLDPEQYDEDVYSKTVTNENPESMFLINPNKENSYKRVGNKFILYPKSNVPIDKKGYEEKKKLRFYSHMFNSQKQLEDHVKKNRFYSRDGDLDRASGYPIPMRFNLSYLQNRPQSGEHYLDYDMVAAGDNTIPKSGSVHSDSNLGIGVFSERQLNYLNEPDRVHNAHRRNLIIQQQEPRNYKQRMPFNTMPFVYGSQYEHNYDRQVISEKQNGSCGNRLSGLSDLSNYEKTPLISTFYNRTDFSGKEISLKSGKYHFQKNGKRTFDARSFRLPKGLTARLTSSSPSLRDKILVFHGPRNISTLPQEWNGMVTDIMIIRRITKA